MDMLATILTTFRSMLTAANGKVSNEQERGSRVIMGGSRRTNRERQTFLYKDVVLSSRHDEQA